MVDDEGARQVTVRRAASDDRDAVLGVLDGANLATDAEAVRAAIDRGAVLVAESARSTLLGALVRDENEISHVAVRRRRRGQGIGTALVAAAAAAADAETLVARFDTGVVPFYEALGFSIERAAEERRFVGRLRTDGRAASDQRLDDLAAGSE